MKKTKFIISLLMALVLAIGFTACRERTTSSEVNEWGYAFLHMSTANVNAREGWNYTRGDAFSEFYSTRFNYELDYSVLNWNNWTENVRIWINSMDMPDMVVFDYIHTDAAAYVEQGLIYRFPDNWQQRWPNAARFYNLTTLGPELDRMFGGTYFYPRARFADNLPGTPLMGHLTLWMRKDWMEAVGFPVKTTYTLNELMEFGRLIRDRDPGNVGPGLVPISGSPAQIANLFLQANSTHWDTFYRDPADGVYKWGAAHQRTLEGLRLMYEAFVTGVLDPEFYLLNTGQDVEKFQVTQQAASFMGNGPTGSWRSRRVEFEANTGLHGDTHVHGGTILGTDGNYHQRDIINFYGTIIFRPDVPTEIFERWMDIMEFNSTREGYITTNMGLKDVDWAFDANGMIISLLQPGVNLMGPPGVGKYPSAGNNHANTLLFDDFAFDNPNIEERYRIESWDSYQARANYSTPKTFTVTDWTLYTFDSPNRRRATFNYPSEFANMVANATSMANLEQIYWNWINSQMGIIQPVLDELNALVR